MIKYCVDKWFKNKNKLEEKLKTDTHLNDCDYSYLVKLVVNYILNDENDKYWSDEITTVDDGCYQGTLLFLIHRNMYQPYPNNYLMTFVYYGSCSGCDTLQSIQNWSPKSRIPTKIQLKDYMTLCKDLVTNMIKPYNFGYDSDKDFSWIEGV